MKRCIRGFVLMGLSLALVACAGDSPAGDDDMVDPPPTPGTPDAGTTPETPDAAPPTTRTYPPGPYGVAKGDIISDRSWMGYMDSDVDVDDDPFNEPPRMISLADFYRGNNPRSRLLVTIQSAGWCGPCQEEASHLRQVATPWLPKGIHFMTAMWQNPDGSPGSTDYAKEWGTQFNQNTAIVADPDDLAGGGFGGTGIPFFILIDTKDMRIIDFPWSADLPEVFQQYAN